MINSLRPLWNYTALKPITQLSGFASKFETPMELHCSQTTMIPSDSAFCLRPLWNYTALKPVSLARLTKKRLRPLWNYTALKPA